MKGGRKTIGITSKRNGDLMIIVNLNRSKKKMKLILNNQIDDSTTNTI